MNNQQNNATPPVIKKTGIRYNSADMIRAVILSKGRVASAARKLGCDPKTIWEASRRNPALNDAIHNQRELFIDTAEDQLQKAVQRGAPWAVVFTLKTIGRERGYTEAPQTQLQQVIVQQALKEEPDPYKLAAQAIALLVKQGVLNASLFELPARSPNGKVTNGHE